MTPAPKCRGPHCGTHTTRPSGYCRQHDTITPRCTALTADGKPCMHDEYRVGLCWTHAPKTIHPDPQQSRLDIMGKAQDQNHPSPRT